MAWVYLIAAGLCEVVWAAGLKKYGFRLTAGGAFTVAMMLLSFLLLDQAMRKLPLGTSYVVWTGIGAVGAAVLGMVAFGEPRHPVRIACIALIVTGIAGLKWSSGAVPEVRGEEISSGRIEKMNGGESASEAELKRGAGG